MRRFAIILLAAACSLLVTAVLIQLRPTNSREVRPRNIPLSELLPVAAPQWAVSDKPVAQTLEMQRAVDELLNYNEAIFRTYVRADLQLSAYVAYWKPGQFHPRMIMSHTPDNCWTGAGWTMLPTGEHSTLVISTDHGATYPGQLRTFTAGGVVQHVVYWHLVGAKPSIYFEKHRNQFEMFFDTFRDDILEGQREQYFIRLSSNRPLESLVSEPLFQKILEGLSPFGLTTQP
jgi:hypothetical protein